QDASPTGVLGEPLGLGEQRRTAGVVAQQVVELGQELGVLLGLLVLSGQLVLRGDQRFRHEPPAVVPEMTAWIGIVPLGHGLALAVSARGLGAAGGHCLTSCAVLPPASAGEAPIIRVTGWSGGTPGVILRSPAA